jgi:hypothetical protein
MSEFEGTWGVKNDANLMKLFDVILALAVVSLSSDDDAIVDVDRSSMIGRC